MKQLQSLQSIEHPWHPYLELNYGSRTGLNVTCRQQHQEEKGFFVPYNYVLDCGTNLKLNHVDTPGYIDVRQAQTIKTDFVSGSAGVRLASQNKIVNSTDPFKASQILSKGSILLLASKLDNLHSIISGQSVIGFFDPKNQEKQKSNSDAMWNYKGKICAQKMIRLFAKGRVNNHEGLMQSKGSFNCTTDGAFDNLNGVVKSSQRLTLFAKEEIDNSQGLIATEPSKTLPRQKKEKQGARPQNPQTGKLHLATEGYREFYRAINQFSGS